MSCCGIATVGGSSSSGGIVPAESTIYEVDFRDLATQPFADGPVTIGDRQWTADGVAAFALDWGIVAGVGLDGNVNNSGFNQWNSAALTAVRIFTTFGELDPEYNPMATYAWEVEITRNNAVDVGVNQSRAILGLVKPGAVEPGTDVSAAGLCQGINNTGQSGVGLQIETTTANMIAAYNFPAMSVLRIMNQPVTPGLVACYCAPPDPGGDWPAPMTYRGCGFAGPSSTQLANLTTSNRYGEHPDDEVHIVMASASGLGFGLTYSRFRVLRRF